ncbi:MAG: TIGR01777 family protein [Campylobacterales bacterium]|nr:TIGR01777 family protein [Campylobacterales bacterium]
MKKIAITGSSGFVGTELSNMFISLGYSVIGITRAHLKNIQNLSTIIDDCELVINLAGANIISRWSDEYKKLLYSSRIDTTKTLIEAFKLATNKPKLFISTSAVGIYDNKKTYDETNYSYSDEFLANLCKDWEKEAFKAQELGIRTAVFRFGIVLGNGGALAKMLLPFKLGVGGTIGDGSQSFSFIHIDDLKNAYKFVLQNQDATGVFNLTAPNPTTNKGLTKALGKALNRPTIFPVPAFVLQLIFSEGAKVLTDGQSVVPKHLLDMGFEFQYSCIEQTIESLV